MRMTRWISSSQLVEVLFEPFDEAFDDGQKFPRRASFLVSQSSFPNSRSGSIGRPGGVGSGGSVSGGAKCVRVVICGSSATLDTGSRRQDGGRVYDLRTDVNDANSLDESRWTMIRIGAVHSFSWNWRYGDIGVLSHLVKQTIDLTSPGSHRWGRRWKVIRVVENDKPLRRITFTPELRVDSTQSCLNRRI